LCVGLGYPAASEPGEASWGDAGAGGSEPPPPLLLPALVQARRAHGHGGHHAAAPKQPLTARQRRSRPDADRFWASSGGGGAAGIEVLSARTTGDVCGLWGGSSSSRCTAPSTSISLSSCWLPEGARPAAAVREDSDTESNDGLELARYRRDVSLEAGRAQRSAVKDRRRRRARAEKVARQRYEEGARQAEREKARLLEVEVEAASTRREVRPAAPQSLSAMLLQDAMSPSSPREVETPRRRKSSLEGASMLTPPSAANGQKDNKEVPNARQEEAVKKEKTKFSRSKEQRMKALGELSQNSSQQSKMTRLWNTRRVEFDELPQPEREAFRKAFVEAAAGAEALDAKALRTALKAFGLPARSEEERREISLLCSEAVILGSVDFFTFCFEVVPTCREVMRRLRKELLLKYFEMYDVMQTSSISLVDCRLLFRSCFTLELGFAGMGPMLEDFDARLDEIPPEVLGEQGMVPFDVLEKIMGLFKEKVVRTVLERVAEIEEQESISSDFGKGLDVLFLYDAYQRYNSDDQGMQRRHFGFCLAEFGLRPSQAWENAEMDQGSRIKFAEFLLAIRVARKEVLFIGHKLLKERFDRLDKAGLGVLPKGGLSELFGLMALVPRCKEDQVAIWRLVKECGADRKQLNFVDCEELALRAREMLKVVQYERVRQMVAEESALTVDEHNAFRDMFHSFDGQTNGLLHADEIRSLLDSIDFKKHLDSVDVFMARYGFQLPLDHVNSETGAAQAATTTALDFEGFLNMMLEIMGRSRKVKLEQIEQQSRKPLFRRNSLGRETLDEIYPSTTARADGRASFTG